MTPKAANYDTNATHRRRSRRLATTVGVLLIAYCASPMSIAQISPNGERAGELPRKDTGFRFERQPTLGGIVEYTDRGTWLADLPAPVDFAEGFESFTDDVSFIENPVDAGGFSLQVTGFERDFRNFVDVPPFRFTDNNGTNHASCFVNLDNTNGDTGILLTPNQNLLAWGGDFNSAGGNELVTIILHQASGATIVVEPSFNEDGTDEFWGFIVSTDDAITSIQFEARIFVSDAGGEGYSLDNVAGVFADDDCDGDRGFVLEIQPKVQIGETFPICCQAPPGAMVVLMVSLGEGPSDTNFGRLCLDLPPVSIFPFRMPGGGRRCFNHHMHCDDELVDMTGYFQFIAQESGLDWRVSNQVAVTITDGDCGTR